MTQHDSNRDVYLDGFADNSGGDEPRSPFRQRGFMLAAGLAGLLLVLGIVVTVLSLTGADEPTTGSTDPATDATSSPPSTTGDNPAASRCGLPGLDTSGTLDEAPKGVTWQLVGSKAVPSSENAGPGVVDESGLRYCFAHTREGAVLMAANALGWSGIDQGQILEHSVASGPGYDSALEDWQNGESSTGGDDESRVQIRGFVLPAYSEDTALVELAMELETGQLVNASLELVWERNDWRLRLAPDGTPWRLKNMTDLAGYVPWRGV